MPTPIDVTTITAEELFGALFDPEVWADPYPLFERLREHDPVLEISPGVWVITSHSEVQAVLRHPDVSSNERNGRLAAPEPDDQYPDAMHQLLVFIDPPDHSRLRRLVVRAFTPRQVAMIEPKATEIVDRLLTAAATKERFDLIDDLGQPLAVQIICELLGVPFEDQHRFSDWGNALARVLDPSVLRSPDQDAAAAAATAAFVDFFADLIAKRRAQPTDDLLSELIAAEDDGDQLTMDELISTAMLILVAGYETTINLVGNGFVALMADRSQYDALCDDPGLAGSATNELLRFDSPAQMTTRIAMADIELDGRTIKASDSIILFIGAANQDPNAFTAPRSLDIGRSPNPHLAFGAGIHHCLGAALARTEATAVFAGLARHFPNIELMEATRRPTFTLRGFDSVVASPSL